MPHQIIHNNDQRQHLNHENRLKHETPFERRLLLFESPSDRLVSPVNSVEERTDGSLTAPACKIPAPRSSVKSVSILHSLLGSGLVKYRHSAAPAPKNWRQLAEQASKEEEKRNILPPPDWTELYRLAFNELDATKLEQRVADARNAILDRIQETITKPSHYNERQQLSDALKRCSEWAKCRSKGM